MKKKAAKKRGGQKGNRNAFKHGFYSEWYTTKQKKMLSSIETTDVTSEINLLRVMLNQLIGQISFTPLINMDEKGNENRDDHYLAQLNTCTSISIAIGTHVRTFFLTNKTGDAAQGIMEAIMSLDPYKEL